MIVGEMNTWCYSLLSRERRPSLIGGLVFGVRHEGSENASSFFAVLFFVDGKFVHHEELVFTAPVLCKVVFFHFGKWWSIGGVAVLSRHDDGSDRGGCLV
jgi:hypothetical protein